MTRAVTRLNVLGQLGTSYGEALPRPRLHDIAESDIESGGQRAVFEIIRTVEQFRAMRHEWNDLHGRNADHHLSFQGHHWLDVWMATCLTAGDEAPGRITIVTGRTGEELRAIAPLYAQTRLGVRRLTWLGLPAAQYGDVLTDGTDQATTLIGPMIERAIEDIQPDILNLRKVRADAAIMPWLRQTGSIQTATDAAPFLDFTSPVSFEQYCSKFPAKALKNRRRLRRRLQKLGEIETTLVRSGAKACAIMETAIDFKRRWLDRRGHVTSALRDDAMADFLCRLIREPAPGFEPFISVMSAGETIVSIQCGIIANRRLAMHLIAYNPDTEKTGAGALHIEDTIAYCLANGIVEFDFLGPDAPYKREWADASVAVSDFVSPCTPLGYLYAKAYLCGLRGVLKSGVESLPLKVRRTLARSLAS